MKVVQVTVTLEVPDHAECVAEAVTILLNEGIELHSMAWKVKRIV